MIDPKTVMYEEGRRQALDLQGRAPEMTGTELNAEDDKIPSFQAAVAKQNMLDRPVGFVCKSSSGRVVKLLQVYDSNVYTQEPEELPAQWALFGQTTRRKRNRSLPCPHLHI